MDTNKSGFVGWAGLVLAILAILGVGALFFTLNPSPSSSTGSARGGGPVFNAGAAFPIGLNLGMNGITTNMGQIQIGRGANQGAWKNTTGRTIYVYEAPLSMAGTASSTIKVYVGTSTTPTATDSFTAATAPFWSQLIDAGQISTSTTAGLLFDSITNHKTSYPGTLPVADGQYVLLVADSFCRSTGACETATSSNRGWTTLTLPFYYFY